MAIEAAGERGERGFGRVVRLRRTISLPHLLWVAILLPAAFVLATELGIAFLLGSDLQPADSHLLSAAILIAGVVAFSLAMFRLLGEKEATILAQARQAQALHEIGAEVSALLEIDRLIALVVDRARELLATDAAGLARADDDGATLYWHHFVSADGETSSVEAIRLDPGQGIAGQVVLTGRTLAISDSRAGLPEGLESVPILDSQGLRSALATPLRSGERVLGALLVANRAPTTFGDGEVRLLSSLANQVAVALANAELYSRAQVAAERLERLIESSGDAIITADLQGRILTWNRGAETIYGWRREEAVGSVIPMVPPDLVADARRRMYEMSERDQMLVNYETERLRKDGARIAVVVTGSPLRNPAGEVIGFLGISKDMSAHRQLEEQQRKLALFEDRERIGMELHDGAIQSLYAVGLGLEAVTQVLESDPPLARARLEEAGDRIDNVIAEIRRYIVGLHPDTFTTYGLVAGLESLAEELKVNGLVDVELDLAKEAGSAFSADAAQEIFQIAREGLANVARHASARRASLSLVPVNGSWTLRVWDNGVGFDPATIKSAGFGLGNMRERARRLGGVLVLTSRPGEGTEVRLEFAAGGGGTT